MVRMNGTSLTVCRGARSPFLLSKMTYITSEMKKTSPYTLLLLLTFLLNTYGQKEKL